MGQLTIRLAKSEEFPLVMLLVTSLLDELGEEGDDAGELGSNEMQRVWELQEDRACALLAFDGDEPVGVVTLSECFALYANGRYGVINEMVVLPPHRSKGAGEALIQKSLELARDKGWSRLDVTAPESGRWDRTRDFYERCGFTFAGPKLKMIL